MMPYFRGYPERRIQVCKNCVGGSEVTCLQGALIKNMDYIDIHYANSGVY